MSICECWILRTQESSTTTYVAQILQKMFIGGNWILSTQESGKTAYASFKSSVFFRDLSWVDNILVSMSDIDDNYDEILVMSSQFM